MKGRNNFILSTALLLISVFTSYECLAQIPNGDFERWDSSTGYKMPVGWDNINATIPSSLSLPPCEQGNPGYSGNYYLELTTRNVTGMGLTPGVAVSGRLDPVTHIPVSGFAYSGRPQLLSGAWQFMGFGSDRGFISILLSKWNVVSNSRDTVSFTNYTFPGMVMLWQQFSLALNYRNTFLPDSAMIFASSSSIFPSSDSYVWLDDLRFADSMTLGIKKEAATPQLSIFPNPARNNVTLSFSSNVNTQMQLSVVNAYGRCVASNTWMVAVGTYQQTIDTKAMSNGIYCIRITDGSNTWSEKFILE